MKFIYSTYYGCTNSSYDNAVLKKNISQFASDWEIVNDPKKADVIIIFSCGGMESTENHCIRQALCYYNQNKNAEIIITGCLPKINYEKLKSNLLSDKFKILTISDMYKYLKISKKFSYINHLAKDDLMKPTVLYTNQKDFEDKWKKNGFQYSPDNTYIQISTGCLGKCSYCAIKYSRGYLKSRFTTDIIEELNEINPYNIKHLVLIGSDCGAYGQDINTNIVNLLESILQLKGTFKISLLYVSPNWIVKYYKQFCKIFETGRVLYINVPIQSGSQAILSAMKREYDISKVSKCLKYFNENYPELLIATGVIVGFPGETQNDFLKTVGFLENIRFNTITYHMYSDRPRTEASRMLDKISLKVKKERAELMCKRLNGKKGLVKLVGQDEC